ncbi:Threonine kinase in B12 biosynthesis [Rhodovulum sp. P5]|uniref:hypothetical protein n=1 Tax=Rhodovulum sp. P5 TaxID=1564506 RepID=UPI0009C1AF0B|nr:hypothetical protein [Rhodovulum sp. P5]ARE39604.1 Threonine kinase in B12 biosynthesis [Rhodovulum sp. P5]
MRPLPVRPFPIRQPRRATVAGHFGELLQGRLGAEGPVALITLPCPALSVRATWHPGTGFGMWQGAARVLSRGQMAELFALTGRRSTSGRWRIAARMPPGGGAGASTAALLAALRCLDDAPRPPASEAAICHAVEGASDPLMHDTAERLLWAPRQARIIAHLPPLPAFDVVGGFAGQGTRTNPADLRFADIEDLVAAWAKAPPRTVLAELATESARRNHALRGGPDPAPVWSVGRKHGALGIVAAHTGTALGLLFAPGTAPPAAGEALRQAGLGHVIRFRTGGRG